MISTSNLILFPLVSLIILSKPSYSEVPDFCYDEENCGPRNWPGVCQSGDAQSPIDIDPSPSKAKHAFVSLESSLNGPSFKIRNTGESVAIKLPSASAKGLFPGEGLTTKKYCLDNAHFHWGSSSQNGSEHSIRGRRYALEIHFVHYDCEYDSIKSALASGNTDALAVAAVFCEVTSSSSRRSYNKALSPIISALGQLDTPSEEFITVDKSLDFLPLIPKNKVVYNYAGSLTTPKCNEQVNWFVFSSSKSCKISESDLKAFRSISNKEGRKVHENNRPVQPLNDRPITTLKLCRQH